MSAIMSSNPQLSHHKLSPLIPHIILKRAVPLSKKFARYSMIHFENEPIL